MEKHDIIKLLQSQSINLTQQRIDIAELLFERPQHLCAEKIIELLENKNVKASKATVYNTLNLFSEHGLLRELYVDAGKVYYDSNTSEHHHIYNIDSGEIFDVDATDISSLPSPRLPRGLSCDSAEVIYRVKNK